jgi:hypothetical protein
VGSFTRSHFGLPIGGCTVSKTVFMRLFFCGTKIEKDYVNLFLDKGFKILFEVV